jgi:pimeloyl-ACP methyl ester carboxylesterase
VSDEGKGFAPIVAAAKAGNAAEATQLLVDFVYGDPGNFDRRSQASRSMLLENARTVLPHVSAPPPPRVTCEQLGQLKVPVTITKGELTRPFFRVLSEAAHRCNPGSQLITFANARHGSPDQDPAAFNEALLSFLARN